MCRLQRIVGTATASGTREAVLHPPPIGIEPFLRPFVIGRHDAVLEGGVDTSRIGMVVEAVSRRGVAHPLGVSQEDSLGSHAADVTGPELPGNILGKTDGHDLHHADQWVIQA